MSSRLILSLVCVVLWCHLLGLSQGFVIQLEASQKACFFEDLQVGDKLGITFEVGLGGNRDISFRITAPTGRILYEREKETSLTYTFVAEDVGRHTYCFGNEMSTLAQKTVTFTAVTHLQGQDQDQALGESQGNTGQQTSDFEDDVRKLSAALKAVRDSQEFLRIRERSHRDTAESTNTRVQWWYIFQLVILFGVCVFQIFYLRNSFEVKQTV